MRSDCPVWSLWDKRGLLMQLPSSKGSGAVGFDDWPRPRSRHYLISYRDKEWIYIRSGFG